MSDACDVVKVDDNSGATLRRHKLRIGSCTFFVKCALTAIMSEEASLCVFVLAFVL